MYVRLIAILMFVGISYAQVDPGSIVAIWLFDEGKLATSWADLKSRF